MDTEYRKFLHELFDSKPPEAFINIWTTAGPKNNRSNWFNDIDKAADFIDGIIDQNLEIYIQPGFCSENLGPGKRGYKKDIAGLPGFFMDIDFKSDSKPHCPPNLAAAISLVEGHGWDPTFIIFTGNGIHAWWLFKECWEFEPDEFKKAEDLNKRLQATIKERAAQKKWTLDSTQDVTRLLRPPGTWNLKNPADKKQTIIAKNSGPRFEDPFEFDDWILNKDAIANFKPINEEELVKISENVVLDKSAEPPAERLEDLLEIDEKFRATWNGERTDIADDSPSGYIMSLANVAAEAGWSDQQISNLIVGFYRRHNHDLRKLHPKKVILTIGKARAAADERAISEYHENIESLQGTDYEKVIDEDGSVARSVVCKILKMDIIRLVQYEQEKSSHYRMYIKPTAGCPKGVVPFYSSLELNNYAKFKDRIFEKTRQAIKLTKKNWETCVANWSKFLIVIAAGDVTAEDRMQSWIEIYLQDKKQNSIDESLSDLEPFVYNGHWYIFGSKFYNWSWQNVSQTEGLSKTDLDFSIIGAVKKSFTRPHPDDPNRRKTVKPYEIPQNIITPKQNNMAIDKYE